MRSQTPSGRRKIAADHRETAGGGQPDSGAGGRSAGRAGNDATPPPAARFGLMSNDIPLPDSLTLRTAEGEVRVATAREAVDLLSTAWPAERGPLHRDALETCLKVLDGHRSAVDGAAALAAAAREAGLLAAPDGLARPEP